MNTNKAFLRITTVLSIGAIIVGILLAMFSDRTDGKTIGLPMAVIAPAVIWGVYGAAYFPFTGFFITNPGLTFSGRLLKRKRMV